MKNVISVLTCVVVLLMLCTSCAVPNLSDGENSQPTMEKDTVLETHQPEQYPSYSFLNCNFYNEKNFAKAVQQASVYDMEGKILCGVVPHHLTADRMISSFFKTAKQNRPDVETVVLIAPMHYRTNEKLSTTRLDWRTPMGELVTDSDIVGSFITKINTAIDDTQLEEDHSASAIIPFVKYYYPDAKVACLLVSGRTSTDMSQQIAELLASIAKEKNCLFVFSVDFSHYLTLEETDVCDEQTREAVLSGDLDMISRMGSDHMDAPRCMHIFISLTELLGGSVYELDHSNSLRISGRSPSDPAFSGGLTSYFIFAGY